MAILHTAGCLNGFFTKCWFSRFSSMQKQHVKLSKQLSSRALPSRPQSDNVKLRSLPSTPAITSARPLSSLSSLSPSAGKLAPLQEILTMENDAVNTYDTADGCVFSKTTIEGNKSPPNDDILEYASSLTIKQLTSEHKFRSLPRLPTSSTGDGMYSVASGDRSPDPSGSLYSSVNENTLSSQHQPLGSSVQDIYSVVNKPVKRNKPLAHQMVGSDAQPQDIYSVVDKSAKFKKGKSLEQLLSPSAEESQRIAHKPGVKKKLVSPLPQQQQMSELYSVVQKKPVLQEKPKEDVYSEINKPATAQQQVNHQPPQEQLYSVVQKKTKPVGHEMPEDVYSDINNPPMAANAQVNHRPPQEQLYSVVNKPAVKEKPKRPPAEDIYSVVNKPPQVKLKPVKCNSEYKFGNASTADVSSEIEPTSLKQSRVHPADLYAEVKPKQIENGDIYSVVNKPPPPVAKKPIRKKRISSDSMIIMVKTTQEDAQSHDSGVEDEPVVPDRCYDDDELEFEEPPELPPRLYSLSDFDTEDELSFDDILEDIVDERTFENPLYQSIAGCRPGGGEDSNPLYQTLASIRKEMDESKPKTGTLKVSKYYCCHDHHVIFYSISPVHSQQRMIR